MKFRRPSELRKKINTVIFISLPAFPHLRDYSHSCNTSASRGSVFDARDLRCRGRLTAGKRWQAAKSTAERPDCSGERYEPNQMSPGACLG